MSKSMMILANPPVAAPRWTPLVARALGATSQLLGRLAARLNATAAREAVPELPPVLEFYASASAPEGALYLNGELVGTLPGVMRL